jgi:co-chaperonin GroES (HSP10)
MLLLISNDAGVGDCKFGTLELEVTATGDLSTIFYNVSGYATSYIKEHAATKAKCFSGSETVVLESGEAKFISEVTKGEWILSQSAGGSREFAEVVAVPHGRNSILSKFVQLVVESGGDIKMSPEHLILTADNCGGSVHPTVQLKQADEVVVGMCLWTSNGLERVVGTKEVVDRGLYTLVTTAEYIVVNDFAVSPFAVNHVVANAYYDILRLFHKYATSEMTSWRLVKEANILFGALVEGFTN